jgi:hypothetical protein
MHPDHYQEEDIAMEYRTITLGLIQGMPELYEQLRSTKRLLPAMDAYAIDLKAFHEEWKERLSEARPNSDPSQISSEALELAIEQLREHLPSGSPMTGEGPTLDGAMAYLKRHTPTA